MKTTLKNDITIKEVCDGFVYNELEGKGLFGLADLAQPAQHSRAQQHQEGDGERGL